MSLTSTVLLNNGVALPRLGFGVYKVADGHPVEQAVQNALSTGYRHIDTAAFYENEGGVGRALASSGLPRREVFITTKVWNPDQGYQLTLDSIDASLSRLNLDYVDLFLVHWPRRSLMAETWRALEQRHEEGKIRAIGVSNFQTHHLDQLFDTALTAPTVNQIELHPHLQQSPLVDYCREHNIVVEAWSPLKRGQALNDPQIVAIADRLGATPAQVIIRWILDRDVVAIPKSVHPARIASNADVFGFELSDADRDAIASLDRNERIGPDPDQFPGD